MAARAVGDESAVLGLRLVGMAGRAAHRPGLRIVRHVAGLASGVAGGRRRCLGPVAARAERGGRCRLRPVREVTARAIGVAGGDRALRRSRVAARAGGRGELRLAGVRRVTREARGGRVVLGGVAGLAADGLRGGGERVGVRRMAADAVAPGMADGLLMARRARARCIGVWRMTGRAGRVLGGSEHRLVAVAARAGLHLGLAEAMRRMAARAARVARSQRVLVDVKRAGARRVALRAGLIRCALDFVHAMAIEAAAQAGMLRLLGCVTARARLGIERRRSMCVVAIAAGLIGVGTDRVPAVLRTIMATHARRLGTGGEAVAVLAPRRVDSRMQRSRLTGMAALADIRRRWRESGIAVARLARDLADVCGMTGTRRHVEVRRRHLLRHVIFTGTATADREQRQHEHAHHGRDPIG